MTALVLSAEIGDEVATFFQEKIAHLGLPVAQLRRQARVDQVRQFGLGGSGLGTLTTIGSTGGRGSSGPGAFDLCRSSPRPIPSRLRLHPADRQPAFSIRFGPAKMVMPPVISPPLARGA